jgi:hypothetical protein
MRSIIAIVAGAISATTFAGAGEQSAYRVPHEVRCYSGGIIIYEGRSDPRYDFMIGVSDDHFLFVDAANHKQTRVGGNCVARWDLPPPP